jgi:hypothetical protein
LPEKGFREERFQREEQCSETITPVCAGNFERQMGRLPFYNTLDRTSYMRLYSESNSRKVIVLEFWTEANNSAHDSCCIKFWRKGAEEKRKTPAAS